MGRKHSSSNGLIFITLGLGLLISLILPQKAIIVILSISLVCCGAALCKS